MLARAVVKVLMHSKRCATSFEGWELLSSSIAWQVMDLQSDAKYVAFTYEHIVH